VHSNDPIRSRLNRFYVGLTLVFLTFAVVELYLLWQVMADQSALGIDPVFYRGVAVRWLDTGVYYVEQQLAGPYEVVTQVHNLYPPHALALFLPFVVLPVALWWILPIGFVAWTVWRLRPDPWAWPILALILALPKTSTVLLYGNSDLWVIAIVAAAVRWGWPAVLITVKPSLAFLAILGIGRRSWWIAGVMVALVTLPLLPLWFEWPLVVANSSVTPEYSLANLPHVALPVVAWLGSRRGHGLRMPGSIAVRLPGARAMAPGI
jgi:hypothetical protein